MRQNIFIEFLTAQEISKLLRRCADTIFIYIHGQAIDAFQFDSHFRFVTSDLHKSIQSHQVTQ